MGDKRVILFFRISTVLFILESVVMVFLAQNGFIRFGREAGHGLMVIGIVLGILTASILLAAFRFRSRGVRNLAVVLGIVMLLLCLYYPTQIS